MPEGDELERVSIFEGNIYWAFPEKNCKPPVEDINGKFQGVKVKVVGIPGGTPKIEEKTWISSGVTVNLTGNPGG